jgi:SpoVK/Ycf46/Vps4 family AAA+-type ATPase
VNFVVKRTHGYVGADLEVLLKHVVRKMMKQMVQNPVLEEIIQHFLESLKIVRPTVLKDNIGLISQDLPNFQSIGGMEAVKRALKVSVLGPLQHSEAFARFNMTPPKGKKI